MGRASAVLRYAWLGASFRRIFAGERPEAARWCGSKPFATSEKVTRRRPGRLVAILTSTELPVAVLAGALLLGEKVTPLIAGGVVVIVGAIALVQLVDRRTRKADQASCAV